MITFIQAGEKGPIKIGFTDQPTTRKKGLQTAHYDELRIIGVMEGDNKLEDELHVRFEAYKIRGEWYRPESEIFKYVEDYCQQVKDSKNTIISIGNGRYRLIFYMPRKATIEAVLYFGTHRNIRVLAAGEPDLILGIEGTAEALETFLREKGIEEQAIIEYIAAFKDD